MSDTIKIFEVSARGMITLRGDLSSKLLQATVSEVVGHDIPLQRRVAIGQTGVAWMSPDELLLLVDYDKTDAITAQISAALMGTHHMVVNVSDARAMFRITGAGAREVIAKGAPVDLSPDSFGVGDIRRSRISQVSAAFWMLDEQTFEVVCFRSVGAFMFDWLSNAAREDSLPMYF